MKIASLTAVVMLAFSSVAFSQEAPTRPIKIGELNRRPVVGKLGLPLGTATEIEAQIISGRELRRKAYRSSYLLKVTHVGGKELDNRPLLTFSVPAFVSVRLANHTFGLHELKTGKKAGTLNSTQIEKLEKGYVGKTVRLLVYEVGRFHGIPSNLPNDFPVWQDSGFHFSTSLTVLAERVCLRLAP